MSNLTRNPYIGPRTYQKDERHLFFGREREARELLGLVVTEQLVLFYSQSGAGKSSLVNTCLIPDLEARDLEVLPVGRVSGEVRSDIDIDNIYIFNLMRSLVWSETDPDILKQLSLSNFLERLRDTGSGYFYDESSRQGRPDGESYRVQKRILIIDQFEELFSTHPEAWEKRGDFFEQVARAMQDDPRLRVILVMREDYIAAIDPFAHLVSGGMRARYYMQRLERQAAQKAVKAPVENLRPYAEGVAERLVDDLRRINIQMPDGTSSVFPGQYVEPVQLQVICYTLWENLSPGGSQITQQDLQEVGEVTQSLGRYYASRVRTVAESEKVKERLIREWFGKRLISEGGIRNLVLREASGKSGGLEDNVIQMLQSDLVRAEARGGNIFYELTHDRLVEPILENNKRWFEVHSSPLQRQAALWHDQYQNESWLLTNQALVEVEQWAKENPDELTEREHEFLQACEKLQAQIDERREAEHRQLEMAQALAQAQASAMQRTRIFNFLSLLIVMISILQSIYTLRQTDNTQTIVVLFFSILVALLAGYIFGRSRSR